MTKPAIPSTTKKHEKIQQQNVKNRKDNIFAENNLRLNVST
jgi:hypothetical protein